MKAPKALSRHRGKVISTLRQIECVHLSHQRLKQNAIAQDELTDGRSQAEEWLKTGYGLDDDVHLYP